MKLLLLTVSAGQGHNAMCQAITKYIQENSLDIEVRQIDLFKDGEKTRKKKIAAWMVNDGYFTLVKYFTRLANYQFEKLKERDIYKKATTLRRNFITPARRDVENVLNEYKPDAVFCAHTFAGILMTDLRNEGNENALKARVVSIVSDFDIAPYTELLTKVDYIVAPTDDFDDVLIKKGFDISKRRGFGIPTQTKFSQFLDKQEARKELGIDENKNTVMMMSGGVGFGNTAKTVLNLNKCSSDFQIICVCGRNEEAKKKLEKLKAKGKIKKDIFIYGFANNVDVMMSAADVLIGKVGGISTSEAFNKNLPMIITKKLPFQEYDNMIFLRSKNACDYISNEKETYKVVDRFFQDNDRRKEMKNGIELIRRPNATRDIVNLLCNLEI